MNLNILIGDDVFGWGSLRSVVQEKLVGLAEKLSPCGVGFTTETLPHKVIKQAATGMYNVVVTDLDYEWDGSRTEGYNVVDVVSAMAPKPLLILCTSSDRIDRSRIDGKIDYLVTDGNAMHKFDELVEQLAKHSLQ